MGRYKYFLYIFFLWSVSVFGDISPVTQKGYTIYPIGNSQIEMTSEKVDITLFPSHAEVKASFIMNNTGPEIEILVGFPNFALSEWSKRIKKGCPTWTSGVIDFSVTVGNEKIKLPKLDRKALFTRKKYFTWKQKFPSHQETEIKVKYWVSTHTGSDKGTKNQRIKDFSYILWSGGPWKGPIGKARISIDFSNLKEPEFFKIKPWGFKLDGKKITWEIEDFEPTQFYLPGIRIQYRDSASGPFSKIGRKVTKLNLKEISEYDWQKVVTQIDAVANDKSLPEIVRLEKLGKIKNDDWRVTKHLFEIVRKISDEIAENKNFEDEFGYYSFRLLGEAQCLSCWPQMVKRLNSGAGFNERKRLFLVYLERVKNPMVINPLIDWIKNNSLKEDYIESAGCVLAEYPRALVPIMKLITKEKMSREHERIFVEVACRICRYSPPVPGQATFSDISLFDREYTEVEVKRKKLAIIYYAMGEEKSYLFKDAENSEKSLWAEFVDKLYRQLNMNWYADYLAGIIPKQDLVLKEEKDVASYIDIQKKLYVSGKLMEVKQYENGNLILHEFRDDNGKILNRFFKDRSNCHQFDWWKKLKQ